MSLQTREVVDYLGNPIPANRIMWVTIESPAYTVTLPVVADRCWCCGSTLSALSIADGEVWVSRIYGDSMYGYELHHRCPLAPAD